MSSSNGILSAIGAVGGLFAGYGSVTLGPIRFYGLAKPKSMPIGGRQAITMHKLPGGGRVLNAMGPDNADIAWSGYLDGDDAGITARALDRLRQSGQTVTLAWDVFSYQVLVSDFCCETQHIPMPYRITCAVVADNSQAIAVALVSIASQVVADLISGNSIAQLSATAQGIVGNTIAAAGAAASTAGAATVGSAAYTTTVNAIGNASLALDAATSAVSSVLAPMGESLGFLSSAAPIGVDTVEMSTQLVAATTACGDLAMLTSATGYVNRAAGNLERASA